MLLFNIFFMNMFGRFRLYIIIKEDHEGFVEDAQKDHQSDSFDGDEEDAIRSGQRCVKLKTKCPEAKYPHWAVGDNGLCCDNCPLSVKHWECSIPKQFMRAQKQKLGQSFRPLKVT